MRSSSTPVHVYLEKEVGVQGGGHVGNSARCLHNFQTLRTPQLIASCLICSYHNTYPAAIKRGVQAMSTRANSVQQQFYMTAFTMLC